jgi:hypothetical protein
VIGPVLVTLNLILRDNVGNEMGIEGEWVSRIEL